MNNDVKPPRWIERLIDNLSPSDLAEEIRGDLYETFELDVARHSLRAAKRNYVLNGIGFLFKRFFWRTGSVVQSNSLAMINNYFMMAWRSMLKDKTFYAINIFGLSVGLACALLIGSYIYSELTYDNYPKNADDIYRVEIRVLGNGIWVDYSNVDSVSVRGWQMLIRR
ncbi:MAG: permease prefix domain 2-containing transporter [Bacteroidota bacterium]